MKPVNYTKYKRTFHRWPEYSSCRVLSRRMRVFYAIKLTCSVERWTNTHRQKAAFKNWHICPLWLMKHSRDWMWTSCFVAETSVAHNKQTVLMRSTNEIDFRLCSLLQESMCCCQASVILRKRQPVWRKPANLLLSSGNTISTALLSLENPRSHTQIHASLRQSFYNVKSQSRGKPFIISVVCYLLCNRPRMFSLHYPVFVVQWFILE